MNFAPIHNHTEFSALDGLSSCREIAQRCQEIGCSCCGISDHGTVAGHLEFAKAMGDYGIKPIFACELYHGVKTKFARNERDQAHFIAGALDDNGLKNLWRLVDASATNFRFVSRVNWDLLRDHSEGLFATSACMQGLVQKGIVGGDPYDALNRYLDIFKDDFYIEIHTYPTEDQQQLNLELVRLAEERGLPIIYATDAHFASPDQYEQHDAYVAMQTGQTLATPLEERKMWHPKSLYIQDEEQIRASLSYLPESVVDEALRNSADLAERCTASPPEIRRHLPAFIPSECPWLDDADQNAASTFLTLVSNGVVARYGEEADDEIWGRALQEAQVFIDAGLEHYFLQAWDFCQFCEAEGIKRGPGRGSAAGALVSYVLGITDVDPLRYGLIFERFYNPGREKGFPDIDNDFPVKDRKRVRDYLAERWGEEAVRPIGTITRMKPKGACDRTYKVFGIEFQEKEEVKKIIDTVPDLNILDHRSVGWSEDVDPGKEVYVMSHVGAKLADWIEAQPPNRQETLINWVDSLKTFTNRVENYGVHASGVVVADCDLSQELPCRLAEDTMSGKKIKVTMFAMTDVDARMFVKQDLLGLANLDILDIWEKESGLSPTWSQLETKDTDESMWRLLDGGLTLGVFQIEDGYGRQLCKELKPRSVEDLGAIVAINRPGPIRAGVPDSYRKRMEGEEKVEVDHPILDDILAPTYGLFIYQEQVMAFFNALGYSLGETDAVRKILGKKRPQDLHALQNGTGEWSDKGYYEMAEKAGVGKEAADAIWLKIEGFAKYSFNKSHAISYAVLAFRTLYAKYTAPAEFIIAGIRVNEKKSDRVGKFVSEARRMGIKVQPPDILESKAEISTIDGNVTFGLVNIKGVGSGTAEYIVSLRDSYDISSPDLLRSALVQEKELWEQEKEEAKAEGRSFNKMSPNMRVKTNVITAMENAGVWDNYVSRSLSLPARQELEKEYLNVILTDECEEIFERHADVIAECDSYSDLNTALENDNVTVPGVITSINPKKTKKDGKAMGIVNIEMDSEEIEFVVFPRQWSAYKFLWKERTPAIFTIRNGSRGPVFEEALRLV